MPKPNLFYVAVVLSGLLLVLLLRPGHHDEISFYGFAENDETEINYNYPVIVEKILVTPGQKVSKGQELMRLVRRKSREVLADQEYKIAELRAESLLWKQKKQAQIDAVQLERKNSEASSLAMIQSLEKELAYKRSLAEGLNVIKQEEASYTPLVEKINRLKKEAEAQSTQFDQQIAFLKKELQTGAAPLNQQIFRLEAEQKFEEEQQEITISVRAPGDGLIGNISCKEEEHISSYSTLMSFYEPHSGIIHGFVHEDLTLEVKLGDQFEVSSLKKDGITYFGTVIGLGSRIVEIPARLRKFPDIKSYGREVLVKIDDQNDFLQKEKVSLKYIPTSSN